MKVPITLHRLENPYNVPPPIAITGNRLTPLRLRHRHIVGSRLHQPFSTDGRGYIVISSPFVDALQCDLARLSC